MSWRWVAEPVVLAIHDEQLAEHGGTPGLRSRALLDSALHRPINKETYSYPSAGQLAAAYAFGLSKDHPFHDGNKRTALVVAETFLELNGHELSADDQDCYRVLTAVAAGELNEEQLFEWFENHTIKVLV
jgi:death-on-curing protein